MSGICAVWTRENAGRAGEALAAIAAALASADGGRMGGRVQCYSDGRAGVGVGAGFVWQQVYQNERVQLACDTDLYNEKELAQWVPRLAREGRDGGAISRAV